MDTRRASFHGKGGTLFGIYLVTMLLSIVTCGIYSFWGRTKLRRYLWGQTAFDGDRFAYHGTAKELLIGWLKVMAVGGVLFGLVVLATFKGGPSGQVLAPLAVWLIIGLLAPVAIIATRAYRLSRTSWRGIRFSLRGRIREFYPIWLEGALLTAVTFGLYGVIFQVNTRRYLTEHTWFGSAKFAFDGEGKELFPRFIRALILTILTLGIYGFWWAAEKQRWYWSHTAVGSARFSSTLTGLDLLKVTLTNLLLIAFTLGIGTAWALVRLRVAVIGSLALEGELDLSAIEQQPVTASATGEALAAALDLGGIDMGFGF